MSPPAPDLPLPGAPADMAATEEVPEPGVPDASGWKDSMPAPGAVAAQLAAESSAAAHADAAAGRGPGHGGGAYGKRGRGGADDEPGGQPAAARYPAGFCRSAGLRESPPAPSSLERP